MEKNKPLKEFDRKIFESVVDKIILGKTYENGENNPYSVTFIFKTGFETEEKCKTKKNKSEDEKMCSYTEDDTRGDGCTFIPQKITGILTVFIDRKIK